MFKSHSRVQFLPSIILFCFASSCLELDGVQAARSLLGHESGAARDTWAQHNSEGETTRLIHVPSAYQRCLRHPPMWMAGRPVTCHDMYKAASDLKASSEVTVDTSACNVHARGVPIASYLLSNQTFQLRPNTTDYDVFMQVYCDRHFSYLRHLNALMPDDGRVSMLDAGSNIGLVSDLLMKVTQFQGSVVAVDANPGTAEVCRRNLERYGPRATVVNAAIVQQSAAEEGGKLSLSGMADEFWGFRVRHAGDEMMRASEYTAPVTVEVETRSLQQLRELTPHRRFDWIKMDIEGEERWIFEGSAVA